MSAAITDARLAAAVWECGRHATALSGALAQWHTLPLPSSQALEHDETLRRLTDQILYRFTKLQDAMGERLVPATLGWLREPCEDWSMRDRLDRLEKLGYLTTEGWLQWREVRNRLAHEYPNAEEQRYQAVLSAVAAAGAMLSALTHWASKLPA